MERVIDLRDVNSRFSVDSPSRIHSPSDVRVQREHRQQLPAFAVQRGHHEQPYGPLHSVDRLELLVGQRQPGLRAGPPAAQIVGVELAGFRQHPSREIVGLSARDPQPLGDGAALIVAVGVDGGVGEVERQFPVRVAERLVEAAGRSGDRAPVKPGVAVGARLAGD